MDQMSNFVTTIRKNNKGFTIHVGENYVGYIVIGENKVPEDAVVKLQDPRNMLAVLAKAELRPFAPAKDNDTDYLDAILGGGETSETEAPINSAEAFDKLDQKQA